MMSGRWFNSSVLLVVVTLFGATRAFGGDARQTAAVAPAATSAPAAATDQEQLEEVEISSQFVATGARSAMKQDVSVLDTPVSVDNYSNSFMKAIETTNVTDLYSYMTGIQRGGATGYDLSIRGFKTTQTDKNAFLVDGLPGLAGRFGSPPTFTADHIEVVKGPASVLYGQGQPGGFVNLITKNTVLDLAVYYELLERYEFTLKVGNVLDRRYLPATVRLALSLHVAQRGRAAKVEQRAL